MKSHNPLQILARDLSTTLKMQGYFRPCQDRDSMKKPMRPLFFFLFCVAFIVAGCSGPKALTKRGAEMQDAGMVKQAAELYYQALRKKPDHIEAMVGLRSAGQGVMDQWMGEFQQASMDGRRKDALGLYDSMTAYKTRISGVDVDLIIPASIVSDYENHLDEHLIELDALGHQQLETEDFSGAAITFREIIHLDAEYGDAKTLLVVAQAEPEYRKGKSALSEMRFRAAHDAFSRALYFDNGYKDAQSLRQNALEDGRFNVAVLNFDSRNRDKDVALELRSNIQNGLIGSDDPFLGIVDRTQRDEIIAEQELSISGLSDEQVEVGALAGARAMLSGAILMYTMETGDPIRSPRQGFRKFFREVRDDEGKIKKVAAYAPAQYTVHTQRRNIIVKYELKLVSTETSEVLFSKVEEVSSSDNIEFATSNVQAGMLYPARSNGEVNRSGKSQMNSLLGARRELMPKSTMRNQAVQEAAARGIRQVEDFLSSYIK
jgi:tetratricopeptide (TPR) repeat protein/curli biogenesis system outer membrane secretion channel CsgG